METDTKKRLLAQRRILTTLMHNPLMNFNKLWNREGESNKFAYHLRSLEKKGWVEKTSSGKYRLTTDGMNKVAYMEDSGEDSKLPIVAVAVLVSKKDSYLMIQRKKEPFYGYWGIHGGKLRSENYILEQAKESIKRETGLTCDLEFKGIFSSKTYANKKLLYNHQLFVVKATNPKGIAIEKTNKGINQWVKKNEMEKLKVLPSVPLIIKIATNKRFGWIEADRVQKDEGVRLRLR